MTRNLKIYVSALLITVTAAGCAQAQNERALFRGWNTDTSKRSIDLDELMSGGPPRDGIPSIDAPQFVAPEVAAGWLGAREPVVMVSVGGSARAYPLQILTWHEIVNDEIEGTPLAVTFCPLCYAAVAYDRRTESQVHSFGVSGLLRHSDMVMYDRETETLWQQLNGEGIVGSLTGHILKPVPAQIVSFEQFRQAYPDGYVLSRDTGYRRDYGRNPYVGYDDIDERPFLYRGPTDDRTPPMEKLVTVSRHGIDRAYPHSRTRKERVIMDDIGGEAVVVFHADGAQSALDGERISESKEVGSTGVFLRSVEGRVLTFTFRAGRFLDAETGSEWNIVGKAVDGPMRGAQLTPLPHGNFFAFAWFAFKPDTEVYE